MPYLEDSSMGGMPAVRFDGTDDSLEKSLCYRKSDV